MKTKHIVLYNLNTNDSKAELEANRESLFRKYNGRDGQVCYKVNVGEDFPAAVKVGGDVGVYILSHTKDVVAITLAKTLIDQLQGAAAKKINLACCKGAAQGKLKDLCDELVKQGKDKSLLTEGLFVCGFNIDVTTFGLQEDYTEKTLANIFSNLEEIKAKRANNPVGSAQQDWTNKKLHLLHEEVGDVQTFIGAVEEAFKIVMPTIWNDKKTTWVASENQLTNSKTFEPLAVELEVDLSKVVKAQKSKTVQEKLTTLTWEKLWAGGVACQALAKLFVSKMGWEEFIKHLTGRDEKLTNIWKMLDNYSKAKQVMQLTGGKFKPVEMSKYSDNAERKAALAFIETANKTKGGSKEPTVTLKFLV